MEKIKFIFYLVKHGSRQQSRINFEIERKIALKKIHFQLPNLANPRKKHIIAWLSKGNLSHLLLVNIAYLKNVSRLNKMFFIYSGKKIVFVRILKSASTSLLNELLPLIEPQLATYNLTDEEIDALSFYYVQNKLSALESDHTKFCLVRNPFARIVSVYLDLFKVKRESFTYANYWFGILRHDMSFKEFIKTISVIPKQWLGPHFSSQHQILENTGYIENITHFRIEKDMDAIYSFLNNFSITLPHRNKQKNNYDYVTFYDQESLELVYQLYSKDVHAFGYLEDFEILQKLVFNSENVSGDKLPAATQAVSETY